MPNKCSVPGCKSNYDSSRKEGQSTAVFRFPPDPLRKELWINMMPRSDFVPTKNSRICANHFLDKFIIREVLDKYDGTVVRNSHRPILTKDAYPSIFPDIESGLLVTSKKKNKRTLHDAPNTSKLEIDNWNFTDKITNFSSLCRESKNYLEGNRWLYELDKSKEKYDKECIQFYMMHNTPGDPRPLFTVTVFSDMHVNVHSEHSGDIPESDLYEIFGDQPPPILVYWSQFVAVISKCSIGSWVSSRDFQTSVCISDLHELPVMKKEDQTEHLPNEESPSSSSRTTDAFGVPLNKDSNNKRLQEENLQLTRKLYNVIFQRNQLLKKMEHIQDLASINLDILELALIIDGNSEGSEEMEKVFRLVKAIRNDVQEMAAGHNVSPEWIKENSNLTQDDDLLQMKFPAFKANSHSMFDNTRLEADDDGEMNEGYSHRQSDSCRKNIGAQSLINVSHGKEHEKEARKDGGKEQSKNYHREIPKCQICGKKCKSQRGLLYHQQLSHKEMFPTQCHICGKIFKYRSILQTHMSVHSDEKRFQCSVCGKVFKHLSTYQKHNRTDHIRAKSYECLICGKIYYNKDYLKCHEKTHDTSKKKRSHHRRSAAGTDRGIDNLYHCKVCDKGYKLVSHLRNHMASHSDEKPFQCNLCGKSFKLKYYLQRHQIHHNDQKPYECAICLKKFKIKSQSRIHQLVVHSDVNHFRCDICGQGFRWPKSLRKHKAVHSENILTEWSSCSQKIDQMKKMNYNYNEESPRASSGTLVTESVKAEMSLWKS